MESKLVRFVLPISMAQGVCYHICASILPAAVLVEEAKEQTMKTLYFVSLGLMAGLSSGCKMSGGASSETASSPTSSLGCQLTDQQVAQLASSKEFQSVEKVSLESMSATEQAALKDSTPTSSCTADQVNSLGESFPSIASTLSAGGGNGTAVAGMGPMGDFGMPGVVRTEYIVVPKAGSRYLAGYNSDGIMVLLLRLMQHRAR